MSSEFERIARFFAPLAGDSAAADGLRDDAAALTVPAGQDLVVSTDTIVETIHYLGTEDPEAIAAKALRMTLSDLCAKGAESKWYTLNLALPKKINDTWIERFCDGLAQDQRTYGVTLIGGDSVSTQGPAVISVTGFGLVSSGQTLRRGGASSGDLIFVTGTIGDGAFGLDCARGGYPELDWNFRRALVARYERPEPPVAFGPALLGLASAAMDISDGLVGDCMHLAAASGLYATIQSPLVPVSDPVAQILADAPDLVPRLLGGGDDYQILAAVPPDNAEKLQTAAEQAEVTVTRIGELSEGSGVSVKNADGEPIALTNTGYTHS